VAPDRIREHLHINRPLSSVVRSLGIRRARPWLHRNTIAQPLVTQEFSREDHVLLDVHPTWSPSARGTQTGTSLGTMR